MQTIQWYRLLAVGVLAAPNPSRAQSPQPKIREIASLAGVGVDMAVRLPNGHVLLYTTGDSIMAYDVKAKRAALVTRGFLDDLTIDGRGERMAFSRSDENDDDQFIWSMPLNPGTGTAGGPAQRVSMKQGYAPSFSPDGKTIAFVNWRNDSSRLMVVPATGGVERILADLTGEPWPTSTAWSDDGKWVLTQSGGPGDRSASLERVRYDGGLRERAITYARPWFPYGSVDGRLALYDADRHSRAQGWMTYRSASGDQGEFRIPAESFPGADLSTTQSLLVRTTRPLTLHLLNLADGKVRGLPLGNVLPGTTSWSPDGHRIAVQTGDVGHPDLMVMNQDGSAQRHYPVPDLGPGVVWSPDGTTLALHVEGGKKVVLLDVASGRTHVLAASPSPIGGLSWRSDGKSIVGFSRHALHEYRLDGTQRLLRDIATEYPGVVGVRMIDDNDALLDYGRKDGTKRFLAASVEGGPARLIPGAEGTYDEVANVWGDELRGRMIIIKRPWRGPFTELSILSTSGAPPRTIPLPFQGIRGVINVLPDSQHVILAGKTEGDAAVKFFLLPLNGGPPRVYPGIPGPLTTDWFYHSLSPDGKALAFTTEGAPVSKLYELDLSAVLQAVARP